MPRRYKRRLGIKPRRNYSQESVEDALRDVVLRHMSFRQAAERHNVPYVTIYRRYRGLNPHNIGAPPVLSKTEEKHIVNALLVAANFGYPMTERDLALFVQGFLNRKGINIARFHNNMPGPDWRESFLKRNPELSVRMSENMKRSRAEVTLATLSGYFAELHRSMEGCPPENIINYDESNLTDDPGKQRVIVRRGVKHARRKIDFSKSSTSIMFCVAADGTALPPYVVYKSSHLYHEWITGGPRGAHYNRSKNGWFDSQIFEDWFFKIPYPYLRRLGGKKIMIGDNLSSHLSINVIKKCEEANIEFKFLPPHSTHLCQPLDVSYFRPLKAIWRKRLTEWKLKNKGVLPKSVFPSLLKKALDSLQQKSETNIKAGFKATGIYPPNKNEVFKLLPQTAEVADEHAAITQSFMDIIKQHIPVEQGLGKRPQRKRLQVQPGKSISSTDFDMVNETPEGNVNQGCGNVTEKRLRGKKANSVNDDENQPCSSGITDIVSKTPKIITAAHDMTFSDESECEQLQLEEEEINYSVFKKAVKNISDIEKGRFVIVEFNYNPGSKKECLKQFVSKVIAVKKNGFLISCLRPYMSKSSVFIFPDVEDLNTVKIQQIKFILEDPIVLKFGRFQFTKNVF